MDVLGRKHGRKGESGNIVELPAMLVILCLLALVACGIAAIAGFRLAGFFWKPLVILTLTCTATLIYVLTWRTWIYFLSLALGLLMFLVVFKETKRYRKEQAVVTRNERALSAFGEVPARRSKACELHCRNLGEPKRGLPPIRPLKPTSAQSRRLAPKAPRSHSQLSARASGIQCRT